MKNLAIIIALFFTFTGIAVFFSRNYKYENYLIEKKSDEIKAYKINLNLADWREFDNLPGIGESLAHEIINERDNNGRYESIADIKRVKGIGEKKFKSIENYLTLEVY